MSKDVVTDQRHDFFLIDNEIIDLFAERLKPHALAVYVCLARFADKQGRCFPAVPTIAAIIHADVKTVRRHLSTLEEVGLIKIEQWKDEETGKQTSNRYTLLKVAKVKDSNKIRRDRARQKRQDRATKIGRDPLPNQVETPLPNQVGTPYQNRWTNKTKKDHTHVDKTNSGGTSPFATPKQPEQVPQPSLKIDASHDLPSFTTTSSQKNDERERPQGTGGVSQSSLNSDRFAEPGNKDQSKREGVEAYGGAAATVTVKGVPVALGQVTEVLLAEHETHATKPLTDAQRREARREIEAMLLKDGRTPVEIFHMIRHRGRSDQAAMRWVRQNFDERYDRCDAGLGWHMKGDVLIRNVGAWPVPEELARLVTPAPKPKAASAAAQPPRPAIEPVQQPQASAPQAKATAVTPQPTAEPEEEEYVSVFDLEPPAPSGRFVLRDGEVYESILPEGWPEPEESEQVGQG